MARKDYFDAACPEKWQILGVQLRPFSFGHYLKLRHFNCAFVADKSASPTLGDLLIGIAVCSMSSNPDPCKDEFWAWWNQPATKSIFATLFRKLPMTPAERQIVKWGKQIGEFDLAEKAKLFADYIRSHTEAPAYWVLEEKGSGKTGAHWSQATITGLVTQCNYTQVEAYNVPMNKALHDYLKAAEESGAIRLMTEEEVKFTEAANGA